MDPLLITVAPNGARRTRADHPALPMTPEQSAETARACLDAGASMIHLHARDETGRHTLDPVHCRAAIDAVTAVTGDRMVVQMTSEAAGVYARDEQMAAVRAVMPEAVSLAVREIFPDGTSDAEGAAFIDDLRKAGVLLQFIVYAPEELNRLKALRDSGAVPNGRCDVLFVLGTYAGRAATPDDLTGFLAVLTGTGLARAVRWAVCAFGPREFDCAVAAVEHGGHVRVGFENNMMLASGDQAPDNAALVRQIAETSTALKRPLGGASLWRM